MNDYKATIRGFRKELILCFNALNRVRIEMIEIFLNKEILSELYRLYGEINDNYFPFVDILKDKCRLAILSNE